MCDVIQPNLKQVQYHLQANSFQLASRKRRTNYSESRRRSKMGGCAKWEQIDSVSERKRADC